MGCRRAVINPTINNQKMTKKLTTVNTRQTEAHVNNTLNIRVGTHLLPVHTKVLDDTLEKNERRKGNTNSMEEMLHKAAEAPLGIITISNVFIYLERGYRVIKFLFSPSTSSTLVLKKKLMA